MKPENVIEAAGLSMLYRVPRSRRRSLREALFRSLLHRDEIMEVWALRDVSFELRRGESLGVVGDNGAGKSTLCLLLSQIMEPTHGRVEVAGRVSALLSLGAGFQPDLTGRDNIFLQGIYLGHSREAVESLLEDIVAFAELGDFIDVPVRTYSSGMRARLAFAIAASIQPEILILDELMGVGDQRFQKKSAARMRELIAESRALVVVSHSLATVRALCTRTLWLEKGRVLADGPTEEVLARYASR
ncbi:MAG TPA: ABC transporter ATP-binding protein [Myxococcota bacterium]|nr:ABC transporter ATP-binding protein [Myxococcota bacterium]HRY96151.1 ABC transporter ATP-binding protein [Myxococcota bacterium]